MIPVSLAAWAARHAIPPAALADLVAIVLPPVPAPDPGDPGTEGWVQSKVRLEAPRYNVWLTRNNVGAAKIISEKTGAASFVRFGLANESKAQNEVLKSADLIGIRAVLVQPWHVGTTIGQFVSREVKHSTWTPGEDPEREGAQMAWAKLITRYGGDAKIVRGEGSFA